MGVHRVDRVIMRCSRAGSAVLQCVSVVIFFVSIHGHLRRCLSLQLILLLHILLLNILSKVLRAPEHKIV